MSQRTAAIALACGLALAVGGVAQAESIPPGTSTQGTSTQATAAPEAPSTTMKMEMPKLPGMSGPGTMISLREVAAIGTGVIVGAALWHVVIGHSFILAGAAIGGWIGDWCYGTHTMPAMMRTGG